MIGAQVNAVHHLGSHALVLARVCVTQEFSQQKILTMGDTKMNYGG
jgi:hypothetical protein